MQQNIDYSMTLKDDHVGHLAEAKKGPGDLADLSNHILHISLFSAWPNRKQSVNGPSLTSELSSRLEGEIK